VLHLLLRPEVGPDAARRAPAGPFPRVGLVVSRSVGPAVTRNLVKRRLRHLFAERIDVLPDGGLLVARALPAAAAASYAELGAEIDHHLARLLEPVAATGAYR
jgi:ribonuclease P protein component